jgi:hypothetical protein
MMTYPCRLPTVGLAGTVLTAAKTAMIEIWDLILIIKVAKGLTSNKSNNCDRARHDQGLKTDEVERKETGYSQRIKTIRCE